MATTICSYSGTTGIWRPLSVVILGRLGYGDYYLELFWDDWDMATTICSYSGVTGIWRPLSVVILG